MTKIKVKQTEQPGLYTVEKEDIIKFIQEHKNLDTIHNIDSSLSTFGILTGADWDKKSVVDFILDSERVAILTESEAKKNFNHSLSVVRKGIASAFDIGVITEKDLEIDMINPKHINNGGAILDDIIKKNIGKGMDIEELKKITGKIFGDKINDALFKFSLIETEYITLLMRMNGIPDTDENYEDIFMKLKLFEKLIVKKYRGEIK